MNENWSEYVRSRENQQLKGTMGLAEACRRYGELFDELVVFHRTRHGYPPGFPVAQFSQLRYGIGLGVPELIGAGPDNKYVPRAGVDLGAYRLVFDENGPTRLEEVDPNTYKAQDSSSPVKRLDDLEARVLALEMVVFRPVTERPARTSWGKD